MRPRKGYTDHAEPMSKLRKALRAQVQADRRMSHERLIAFGVEKILDTGLFDQYEREFKGYIVTNALTMALRDDEAAEDTVKPPKASRKPLTAIPAAIISAEKAQSRTAANEYLADLAPVLFMKLPTPFKHANGMHKTLGELTGKEGRKLVGALAAFFKGVPDNKRLIDVKSEGQLRELWAKN